MQVETMKVKSWDPEQGDHVVINRADFDPKVHTEYVEPGAGEGGSSAPKKPSDGLTVPQLKEALAAKNIAIPEGAKKPELVVLLDAAAGNA